MPDTSIVTRDNNTERGIVTLSLNRPEQRNAMTLEMFDALEAHLRDVAAEPTAQIVFLRGEGKSFCTGFDLGQAVDDPPMMGRFIERLSAVNRLVRRMPGPVVVAVQGHALAGGCALISACDFIVAESDALFGYPVHRIGVSPAVTLPTLMPALGPGGARWMTMSGRVINGAEAHERGLVTQCVEGEGLAQHVASEVVTTLSEHGRHALTVTKSWLNELEDAENDARYDAPVTGSMDLIGGEEATSMLRTFWEKKTGRS